MLSVAVSPTAEFTDFVKSTYRVLLTRGLRGCYVYFMDAATRDFFLSRTERGIARVVRAAESPTEYVLERKTDAGSLSTRIRVATLGPPHSYALLRSSQ